MIDACSLNVKGANLWLRGDIEGARFNYLAALHIDPNYIPSLVNLGVLLGNENKLNAAEVLFQRATYLDPSNGHNWNNLGNILTRLKKFDLASKAFYNAEALIPDNPGFWHNKGLLAFSMKDFQSALRFFEKTEALGGFSLALQNDIAHALLALGNLQSAYVAYEARWDTLSHLQAWDYHIPEWKGENLEGKKILFHGEQGFGDTIMVSRFGKMLSERGAQVVYGVPPTLVRLFEFQNWDCISLPSFSEEQAREFDFQTPMYSAMRWLEVDKNEINSSPYLVVPNLIVPPVFRGDVFNVGICWTSGRRGGVHDWRLRSSPLEYWLPLASIPNVHLWSLQKSDDSADIIKLGAEGFIKDCTHFFEDWADTAAFISQLDLIISVDTAVVHLAGALGKPCWMLSQFVPCWRWWNIDNGSGRPWYDSVSIIPQPSADGWKKQLEIAVDKLKEEKEFLRIAA